MDVKKEVREAYSKVALGKSNSCCGNSSCCNPAESISKAIGYSLSDISAVPDGANLGLGCGNPTAIANIKEGETVLDLGSGAGFDCFLAANKVGKTGKIIGVDMTPEMLDKARNNAKKGGYENVEFRLGEIENLPVADNSVNLIISNCVINLSENKPRVLSDAFRVLKPGGRVMISDLVLDGELPANIREMVAAYVGCFSGAISKDEYVNYMEDSGFKNIQVVEESSIDFSELANDPSANKISNDLGLDIDQLREIAKNIKSAKISAFKI
jgi:ubiquinone/menaquinone biosynthesis C-methylase UbiE